MSFEKEKCNFGKMDSMAAASLDNEFIRYWALLSPVQKESLLGVIKSFVIPRERISAAQYNKEIDEAIARVEAGENYSQDEVEKLSNDW